MRGSLPVLALESENFALWRNKLKGSMLWILGQPAVSVMWSRMSCLSRVVSLFVTLVTLSVALSWVLSAANEDQSTKVTFSLRFSRT